jgi:hypothetical protein
MRNVDNLQPASQGDLHLAGASMFRRSEPLILEQNERTNVTFAFHHLHLKSPDPEKTAQFYIDNFRATLKDSPPGRALQLDMHGLQVFITALIPTYSHEQHYGIEHIALETDDYAGTLALLKSNGAHILEEMPPTNGRRICFVGCPDGAQVEVIERIEPE